jgi:hypothetical protein
MLIWSLKIEALEYGLGSLQLGRAKWTAVINKYKRNLQVLLTARNSSATQVRKSYSKSTPLSEVRNLT